MNADHLEQALRVYCRRRPFRSFHIEFNSGGHFAVAHPESIRREGPLFVGRTRDGRFEVFAADNVSRLFDPAIQTPAG